MGFGIKELVVILLIVLLLFGTKKLKSLGTDLGSAIKGFRKSVTDENDKEEEETGQLEQQASDSPDAAAAHKTAERETK